MASGFSLARLYGAAGVSTSVAKSLGSTAGGTAFQSTQQQRRNLLRRNINLGTLHPEQLSMGDKQLLGVPQARIQPSGGGGGGGILGGVGKFLGNLGSDITTAGKYFVPGLYHQGLAVGGSLLRHHGNPAETLGGIFSDLAPGGKDQEPVTKELIRPTVKQYRDYYGHDLGKHFVEHPLQGILDVATVASLGTAGAARAGITPAVRLTSRAGRAPLIDPATSRAYPRQYSNRPLANALQRASDKLAANVPPLQRAQLSHVARRQTRRMLNTMQAVKHAEIGKATEHLRPMAELDDHEAIALTLAQAGVNTPGKIEAFQSMVRRETFDDPEKLRQLTTAYDLDPKYLERMVHLPDDVRALILEPNQKMLDAHRVWAEDVASGQDALGITDEMAGKHLEKMREHVGVDETPGPDYPINEIYVPMEEARGFAWHQPRTRLGGEARFMRGRRDRPIRTEPPTSKDLFAQKKGTYLHESTGETFRSGAFRTDVRLYFDHAARRAGDAAENLYKSDRLNRIAMKDDNGELMYFKNRKEMEQHAAAKGINPDSLAFVNDQFPLAFFRKEIDHLDKVRAATEKYLTDVGDDTQINLLNDPQFEELIGQITDQDAKAFVATHWGVMKRKGVAIPLHEFEYERKFAGIHEAFGNPIARGYARWMNRWRAAVLTYMPRWALNTAAGSFLLNTVRGVNFRDYMVAQRLQKADLIPPGVNLGHQTELEWLELAAPGYKDRAVGNFTKDFGIRMPTRKMLQWVQNIENYFRRAQFVHNLRAEGRYARREEDGAVVDYGQNDPEVQAMDEIKNTMSDFYKNVLDRNGKMIDFMQDPKMVEQAIEETDKFSYNYSVLGPFERRVVRQFIPFWGWYKFITMFAYKLPVLYPGRTQMINQLSMIAKEDEKKYGAMPTWVRAGLPLSFAGGKFKYISTLGLNPLAQFANPLSPQGAAEGAISVGQFNPLVQAGLSASGFDPLTMDRVAISPQSGASEDFFGNLYNLKTGEQINAGRVGSLQRFVMGLMRSLPQFRLAERYELNPRQGFGANYPESIPLLAPRPMGPVPEGGATGILPIAFSSLGTYPKTQDLKKYGELHAKGLAYARTQNRTQLLRLRRRLSGQAP